MPPPSLLEESFAYLEERLPLYALTRERLCAQGPSYVAFAERLLTTIWQLNGGDPGYHRALDAFIRISLEYITLQVEMMKTGRYRHSRYAEVKREVYDNPEVMKGYYLEGLLLSQVFWVNHYRTCKFLLDFLADLPCGARGIDLACGSGIQSALALDQNRPLVHGVCDISPVALDYARRLIRIYVQREASSTLQVDATRGLPLAGQSLDYLICCELVEHLERPAALMAELRRVLKRGGSLFFSTVAFTAALDHIHMFESAGEIDAFLAANGFDTVRKMVLPVSGREEDVAVPRKPLNVACVLTSI